jgi:hypothetical protein
MIGELKRGAVHVPVAQVIRDDGISKQTLSQRTAK